VPSPRHTRRQALILGAAAVALAGARPRLARAAEPALFELDVPDDADRALAAAAGWRTTGVLRAPRRFDLAGVRWRSGDHAEVQLRARRRGGRWTAWTGLPAAADHGPDAGRAAAGTEPAWTGPADELQLRIRGRARGLRVRFVHAGPAARAVARRRRLAAAAPKRRARRPIIIPRAEWGAAAVPPRTAPSYGQVLLAFVHHTVTAADYGPEDSAAMVLGIARYHRDTNGWNDIGYNFLVDKYGQIFEGRAGGIDQAIVGAQAQGWNSVSTGVACLGTFTDVSQTEAGMDALARLIGWKLSLHGVPVQGQVTAISAGGEANRYPAGHAVVFERISGHRDGDATSCPGEALYAQLPALRARAAGHAGPLAGLSMRTSTDTVRGIAPIVVSGWLRFADGSSPAGAPVEVLFTTPGSAYQRIAVAQCAADGGWSATVTLTQAGTVFARYPGDGLRRAADSPKTDITILPRLTLALSAPRLRRGRRVRAAGTVTPALATSAVVVVEWRVRGAWRRVGRRRVPVVAGRFATRVRLRRAGRHRITVVVPGAVAARQVRVRAS
jgi:hypothetical protein